MTLTHWILILTVLILLLLIAAVVLLLRRQTGNGGDNGKELALLGQAVTQTQGGIDRLERVVTEDIASVKTGVSTALSSLAEKTVEFTRQNYETQLRITESLSGMQEFSTEKTV